LFKPPPAVLNELKPYLVTNSVGQFQADRSYRVQSVPELKARVFLQGFCESTHGVGDGGLSILASRSAEILKALLAREPIAATPAA
jgi:L-ornithine N5-oxygenase